MAVRVIPGDLLFMGKVTGQAGWSRGQVWLRVLVAALLTTSLVLLVSASGSRTGALLINTVRLAAAVCILAIPVGTLLALLLVRTDLPARRLLGFCLVVGLFTPLYLQAAGWDAGFGRLGWFTFSGPDSAPLLNGWRGAIWIHGCAAVPWVTLIVATQLIYVEGVFEEMALLEASRSRVIGLVTLRRSLPAIGVATLWVSVMIAAEITVTDLYQVRTFAEEIYVSIPLESFAAIGLRTSNLVLAYAALLAVATATIGSLTPPPTVDVDRHRVIFPLGTARIPASLIAGCLVVLLIGIPLANLVINAGLVVRPVDGEIIRGWEFRKFLAMVLQAPVRFRAEIGWTLAIAFLSALAAMSVALPIAWYAARHAIGAMLAILLAAIGLATPGPLIGLGVIWLLNREAVWITWLYDRTLLAPCLAIALRGLPIAILVSWYAIRSVASDTLEAARAEGLGSALRLLHIAAPQRLGAFVAAWLIVTAISFGDLAASILVTPPGISTIATRVFGLLHAGVDDQVAGLCLASEAIVALLALLSWIAWSRLRLS